MGGTTQKKKKEWYLNQEAVPLPKGISEHTSQTECGEGCQCLGRLSNVTVFA